MGQSTSTVGFFSLPGNEPLTQLTLAALVLAYENQDPNLPSQVDEGAGTSACVKAVPGVNTAIAIKERGVLVWLEDGASWTEGSSDWRVRNALATFLHCHYDQIAFFQVTA